MAPLEINVTGTGATIRPAERAILILSAHSTDLPTAAEASAIVTTTAISIRETISPYCPQDEATGQTQEGAAIAHYSMTTMDTTNRSRRIGEETGTGANQGKTKYETVYSARAEFHIKFSDFAVLNTLATHFSAMGNVKIARIEWKLTDATLESLHSGARMQAAHDAIQRAYDYAEVFGGLEKENVKGRVKAVHVKENNYYSTSTRPQLHYGKGLRGSRVKSEELQFQPEDVRLQVSVDGNFEVEV